MHCFTQLSPREGLWRYATVLAAGLCVAFAARAADAPLTLQETLRLAARESRQLAAQDAAVAAAGEMSVSAGQLPDPVLRLGIDNLPVTGDDRFSTTADFMTMRRIGVMQELTRGEKRRLRAERGEREADRERANRSNVLANVQRDAALAWLERYYAEQTSAVLDKLAKDTRASVEAAEAAYRGGRGTRTDLVGAQSMLVMVDDRRAMLERQLRAARIALVRWIGADAERPLQGPPPDLGKLSLDVTRLDDELQHHPVLGALAQQVALADADVRLARAAKIPDWSVELAYQQRGPAFSNMVSIGLSVPLPIAPGRRQDRDVAAKLAMAEQARAQLDDALRMHTAEVRAMVADWETGRDRMRRYESELLPLAAQRTDAALAAYRGNTGTLGAVLDARRNETDTRMQLLQLATETARVWAQLNFLVPAQASTEAGVAAGGRWR
jgi:outer membrane protein TolC